jgi:hypothetical protein
MVTLVRIVLEATPYCVAIFVDLVAPGVGKNFKNKLRQIGIGSALGPADIEDIVNAAILSYDQKKAKSNFIFSMVSTLVIFINRTLTTDNGENIILLSGLVAVCFILGLWVWAEKRFGEVQPNKYVDPDNRINRASESKTIRPGRVYVLLANVAPLLVLLTATVLTEG